MVGQACCRDCNIAIGKSRQPKRWKAWCLDCAQVRIRKAIVPGRRQKRKATRFRIKCRTRKHRIEEMKRMQQLKEAAWEQEKTSLKSEIAALRRTLKDHLRTCPATRNKLMLEQGESTTFADVCVVAGGTVMPVHGAILASRSPVFEAMLNLPMREGRERLIQIEDMSAKALWEFLFFLYTGRFRRDFDVEELGTEVLAAAHKYDVAELEDALWPFIEARSPSSSEQ